MLSEPSRMNDEIPHAFEMTGSAADRQFSATEPGKSLDNIPVLDEASRPKAAAIRGATSTHREQGRRLGLFHRIHLDELAAVRIALDRLVAGTGTVEALSEGIASMSMIENYRGFGNLCGSQCVLLQMHHDIEESSMYPILGQHAGLRPVLDRLSKEHEIVGALLDRIRGALSSLAVSPSREAIFALREIYDVLEKVIVSHFKYEEHELAEAIGFYGAL
jgi:Hemerythrin HHE cation binding domain